MQEDSAPVCNAEISLLTVRLIHRFARGFDRVCRRGRPGNHGGDRIAERAPVVSKFLRLRARETAGRNIGEGLHQRIGGCNIAACRWITSVVRIESEVILVERKQGEVNCSLLVRAIRVDVPAVDAHHRHGRALRPGWQWSNAELVAEVFLKVAKDPRPNNSHIHLPLSEGCIHIAFRIVERGSGISEVLEILKRIHNAALIGYAFAGIVHDVTAEARPESPEKVRGPSVAYKSEFLSRFYETEQVIGRSGRSGDRALVVIQADCLGNARHRIDFAVNSDTIDASFCITIQFPGNEIINRSNYA